MEALIEWSAALRPLQGQTVSGDRYLVETLETGFLIAAIDGLGHGDQAAAAARIAADVLKAHRAETTIQLLERCHEALKQTRGAAISLASIDNRLQSLHWCGVGNVEGVLVRARRKTKPASESIPLRGGVVGYQLPPLRPAVCSVEPQDMIIFATDGIRSRFTLGLEAMKLTAPAHQVANDLLAAYDKGTDDSLVLVVRYLG